MEGNITESCKDLELGVGQRVETEAAIFLSILLLNSLVSFS